MTAKTAAKRGAGLAAILCLFLESGCNTSGSSQAPSAGAVRSSSETAPTDLQLLCAAQAAEELQVADGNVLPVSSMRSGEAAYQVNLTFTGGQAVCVIDESGMVRSVTRV